MKRKSNDELTEKQAARIIEIYENGARNGEEWAHDVCLHRGTEKYETSLNVLNEAFRIANSNRVIFPLAQDKNSQIRRIRRR